MTARWRSEVHAALHGADDGAAPGPRALRALLVLIVVASALALVLQTVERLAARFGSLFAALEALALTVLAADYALRLWFAPEGEPGGMEDAWEARLAYARSALGIVDFVAVVPAVVGLLLPIPTDWLRVVRLLRLLKLARHVPALSLFAAVIRNESRPLLAALMAMSVLLVLNSAVMFVLERDAQPTVFASIPHAMWWAIVTMATVGYGDIVPVTGLGKVFGSFVMVLGIAMFAVPAGILATGFAIELRKRDFVVTWHTVARVPLFASLDAARIADIARLLKREVVPAKYAIVRRGEPADAMFFIMAGEVEVDRQPSPIRLGRGQYFGEIALLHDTVRTATVTALTECQLLALDAADFRRLLDAHPDLRAAVTRVAEQRLRGGPPAGPGPEPRVPA